MKSNLFSKVDVTGDDNFKGDFDVLCSLKRKTLELLPNLAVNVLFARSERETDQAKDDASTELRVPRSRLDRALRVTQFFLGQFVASGDAHDDEPSELVEDLVEAFGLSEDKDRDSALEKLVSELKRRAQETVERRMAFRRHEQSAMPLLASISTTVNFRAVFDQSYKVGMDVSQFTPQCLGSTPLGIIQLGFDEGLTREVFFQADRRTINLLIEHLQALQKQLDIAQKHLGLAELSGHDD